MERRIDLRMADNIGDPDGFILQGIEDRTLRSLR
jgi:hypothetical protein